MVQGQVTANQQPPRPITGVSYFVEINNVPSPQAGFVIVIDGDDGRQHPVPEQLAREALHSLGDVYPRPNVRFLADASGVITEFL